MSVEDKAVEIFEFFANGGDRLTISALIALHRATEDSGESDANLRMMFSEMLEEAYPVDFDPELGLTKKGLVHSYTSGLAGDVHKDYEAVKGSGALEKHRKAEFIFEYFAKGSDWISFKAMIALHRATEDSGMSDSDLIDGFMEIIPDNCAPEEFDRAIGLRKSALLRSYTEGWGGSVESDFDAINENRLDFFVKEERKFHANEEPDPKVAEEAKRACRSEEKRATHGFQIIMSFGARGNDDGSPLEVDGMEVGSGIDVVNYLHAFLCHWFFGSLKEGTRHIYYDWHNLKGLPGTKEVPKPTGAGVMRLNPAWKVLYRQAFEEARLILFLISTSWLESPNCHEEFFWLLELMKADPEADKDVFFWILDEKVQEHPNWQPLLNMLNKAGEEMGAPPGAFDDFILPFKSKDQQNTALEMLVEFACTHCKVWHKGARKATPISMELLEANYQKGVQKGIPGFES